MADTERWRINESLLQSYRSLFISSQSFLLSVGAIIADKSTLAVSVVAVLSLFMIWVIWFPMVRARHLIVDYYKYGVSIPHPKPAEVCSEDQYVHDPDLRKKANEAFGINTNWRSTRVKLDFITPVIFTAIWVVLVIHDACYA